MSANVRTVSVEHNITDDKGNVLKTVSLQVPQAINLLGATEIFDGNVDATVDTEGNFLKRRKGKLKDGEQATPWSVVDVVNAFLANRAKAQYQDPIETKLKIERQLKALMEKAAAAGLDLSDFNQE